MRCFRNVTKYCLFGFEYLDNDELIGWMLGVGRRSCRLTQAQQHGTGGTGQAPRPL